MAHPFHDSARLRAVQSPIIPVVAELIRNAPGTISLGQGVVYYGPPSRIFETMRAGLEQPHQHRYQAVHGLPVLLDRIAGKLAAENGVPLGAGNTLVITAGGNMAFMNALLAITDPGDEVILQVPFYFNHEMAVTIAGCRPVLVPTNPDYQLQPDLIRQAITPSTRAVVTVSPNNPSGAVYPEAALRQVNQLCQVRGLFHIHDEAYEYFTYDGARHFSPASIPGSQSHTISLYSLSKAYGFASWRIGYMVVPESLFVAVKKIQDTILICPPVVSQHAAVGALETGPAYCRERLAAIAEMRTLMLERLHQLGSFCQVPKTDGAFYFLLRLDTDLPPLRLVERLVHEYGVAAIPGTAFGLQFGCYLRVAYGALEKETATEGIDRLARGLKALVAR